MNTIFANIAKDLDTRTATLTRRGPLGARTVEVEWKPLPVSGIDGATENIGRIPVAFLDNPPVHLAVSNATSAVVLRTSIEEIAGDSGQAAIEADRIDDPDAELQPGEFRILSDTDD